MNDIPTLQLQIRAEGCWHTISEMEAGDVNYTDPFRAVADHSTVPTRIVEQYGEPTQGSLEEVLNDE